MAFDNILSIMFYKFYRFLQNLIFFNTYCMLGVFVSSEGLLWMVVVTNLLEIF